MQSVDPPPDYATTRPSVTRVVTPLSANLQTLVAAAIELGPCQACERDLIGGAVFTNPAVAVVTARHPRSEHTHRTLVCPGHAADVITEHLDRGRQVTVEAPTLPAASAAA